jgi:hypothetical protein
MTPLRYRTLLNAAGYQLLWFTAVLGGDAFLPVLGLLLLLHLALVRDRLAELALMLGAALLGGAFEFALSAAGFYRFGDAGPALPLWLPAIWMGFAATLRHSLAFLVARPRLLTAAATLGAPLTYLAAARLGAVTFPFGAPATALAVGLSWWAITPLLLRLEAATRAAPRLADLLSYPSSQRSEV